MRCIYCGCEESRVVDSRAVEDGNSIRRRRECEKCGRRFTTYEKVDTIPLMVVKKDKRREPFDSEKLRQGILKACEKRPVSMSDIDELTSRIEMRAYANDQEITSAEIGEMVMDGLKELDKVSYVRFASVYRQFTDLENFIEELNKLLNNR
ncbi:MAG: transcriptional repressor NrdR [Clostridia bacterium]|nr:transcriptional repressor NrdR [Clostridia bacterium]MBO4884004.1 transcriptional repressor NrdR [Clostridia bacterium]MBR4442940.1 transcriptional repressor NrdR [Clostridia bacterium]